VNPPGNQPDLWKVLEDQPFTLIHALFQVGLVELRH
jgi:hypothetical protein